MLSKAHGGHLSPQASRWGEGWQSDMGLAPTMKVPQIRSTGCRELPRLPHSHLSIPSLMTREEVSLCCTGRSVGSQLPAPLPPGAGPEPAGRDAWGGSCCQELVGRTHPQLPLSQVTQPPQLGLLALSHELCLHVLLF